MAVSRPQTRLHTFPARVAALIVAVFLFALAIPAQQSRIIKAVDNRQRIALAGHLHPKARAEFDQGRVSPGMELSTLTLQLAQTPAQSADLAQLLKAQQTRGSAEYHHWLTPEQYAERFGVPQADIDKITTWLQGQGLEVASVARGRNAILVNGRAAQVEAAFQIELHHYLVNANLHYANANEPTIPEAFQGVIAGVRGLHDFRMKARLHAHANPHFNASDGEHFLAPDDVATIYNVAPLYAAGINGSGQTIVVAGQTVVNLSDINTFRSTYNLSSNPPETMLVPGNKSPGISQGDLAEADLDLEWSGALARSATILYVYAPDVMTAVQYAIDQNLAPVLSSSYGLCELETASTDMASMRAWAQQGNSQGITWVNASGDAGGADCDDNQNPGLSVDAPASIPEVTGVGGTEFNEGSGNFWAATNNANSASALSFIPEMSWNDSLNDGTPSATGGGASIYFTKPSWQVGNGVPSDNARHVPDISFSGSNDHDPYQVFSGGSFQQFGGTSVPTPVFAGMLALLNQQLAAQGGSAGLGNINPNLYALAGSNPAIFHDVTAGNNLVKVNCPKRQPNCANPTVGFNAGPGYDETTGLGSADIAKLINGWTGAGGGTPPPTTSQVSLTANLKSAAPSDVIYLVATVTNSNGITPTVSVTFEDNGTALGSAALAGSAGSARATLAVQGVQLASGGQISAVYQGSSSSAQNVSVSGASGGSTPSITNLLNAAGFQPTFSPGGIIAIFGTNFSQSIPQQAAVIPLPITMSGVMVLVNGIPAPLYYVSSTQINAQIPYEAALGGATLTVNNNGKVSSQGFTIKQTGVGVFTGAGNILTPYTSGARGQEIALFITGAGQVSPPLFTGSAPNVTLISELPAPLQTPIVSVGGVKAILNFVGIPDGLVGVVQINFTIPTNIPTGVNTVQVAVGNSESGVALVTVN